MINLILFLSILLFLAYSFYDQFGMDYLKGKTVLKVRLEKQNKIDMAIFIVLIFVTLYQNLENISSLTLYLFATIILLAFYGTFIRFPTFILKENGFFFGNIYVDYHKIYQVNVAQPTVLVIDLRNGKRLIVRLLNEQDRIQIVHFFNSYKREKI